MIAGRRRACGSDDVAPAGARERAGVARRATESQQRRALLDRVRVDRPRPTADLGRVGRPWSTADLGRRVAGRQQAQEPIRQRHRVRPLARPALRARYRSSLRLFDVV